MAKTLIANLYQLPRRLEIGLARHDDPGTVKRLDRVNQRRPIMLLEDIPAHLKHVIWAESQEVAIEGCVMQGAQRQPVSDEGLSGWFRVRDYVGGIKELFMAQAAECALTLVGLQHTLAKGSLVKSHADCTSYVHATGAIGVLVYFGLTNHGPEAHMGCIVDRD